MTDKERIEQEVQACVCEFMHVHDEIVDKVKKVMPEEQELLELAEFFKVFGDSTRIKILYALSQSEMCVCDIATLLQMGTVDSYFPSAAGLKADASGKFPQRRKDHVLFPVGRPHPDHIGPGHGAYCGVGQKIG